MLQEKVFNSQMQISIIQIIRTEREKHINIEHKIKTHSKQREMIRNTQHIALGKALNESEEGRRITKGNLSLFQPHSSCAMNDLY